MNAIKRDLLGSHSPSVHRRPLEEVLQHVLRRVGRVVDVTVIGPCGPFSTADATGIADVLASGRPRGLKCQCDQECAWRTTPVLRPTSRSSDRHLLGSEDRLHARDRGGLGRRRCGPAPGTTSRRSRR